MGEAEFGLKKGVLSTRPGWLGKVEVVEVKFDPQLTTYEELARHAAKRKCAQPIFACNDMQEKTAKRFTRNVEKRGSDAIRWVKDNKYYTSRRALKHLPLTETQATRINASLDKAALWLSPQQKKILALIEKHPKAGWPDAIGVSITKAWARAEKVAAQLPR